MTGDLREIQKWGVSSDGDSEVGRKAMGSAAGLCSGNTKVGSRQAQFQILMLPLTTDVILS